jgi:hypothetical protein
MILSRTDEKYTLGASLASLATLLPWNIQPHRSPCCKADFLPNTSA